MIKWLAWLLIVWVAIIFVASATEEILHGRQQLVEASNKAVSATTAGHAAFPPVERESRIAHNALNTRKKARLQTDGSDDALVIIGPGTRGAYPSYPRSFGQSSRSGVISVLNKSPIHLSNHHEPFKFTSNDHWLFPFSVSLEQVNSQASSSTTSIDLFSDFDKTRETDACASTKHYIPSETNPPEIPSELFNLRRKTQFQIDAPINRGPLGNSVTQEKDGRSGTKRKIWNPWGHPLPLKTGVTSDETDAQHSYATPDFRSGFRSEQPNRLSAEENYIATTKFNPQEIQQVTPLFQKGINQPSYQNAGASAAPMLSTGGRIPQEMSRMAGQNGENDFLFFKPTEKGANGNIWGAHQGINSSPSSQTQHSLGAEQKNLFNWPKSTEPLLNRSPRPQNNVFESRHQSSSSEYPEHIHQILSIPKTHQPETITTVGNHPSRIDGMTIYGRIKFNTDLFKGDGPYQLERSCVVKLLNSMPIPSQGNFLLTDDQLDVACVYLRSKHSIVSTPSMNKIGIFMGNINKWYQYWNTHAKIDPKYFYHAEGVLRYRFVFPLFLLYVEMIISIIPFKRELKLGTELDYPKEMRNAIETFLEFNKLIKNPPQNRESIIWIEKRRYFNEALSHNRKIPSASLWPIIEFWMESHYKAVWNKIRKSNGVHACDYFKAFLNTIFTYGIQTLNEHISCSLPHE